MENEIVNRVTKSPLITIDLETFYPDGERILIDFKEVLYQGMILREKDFREWVKQHDWKQYTNKYLAITCSTEAIIPVWAYMLIATKAAPFCKQIILGSLNQLEDAIFEKAISEINVEDYQDKMVVIKGCSKLPVPDSAYLSISNKLMPHVKSIMYGEPCSTVPVYKKPRK